MVAFLWVRDGQREEACLGAGEENEAKKVGSRRGGEGLLMKIL